VITYDYCKARLKKRFGKSILDIKLKNRLRKVIGIENSQDLAEYIESNLEKIRINYSSLAVFFYLLFIPK
jgi:hypothetical protein